MASSATQSIMEETLHVPRQSQICTLQGLSRQIQIELQVLTKKDIKPMVAKHFSSNILDCFFNWITGRRGGGRSGGPSSRPSQPQTISVTQEFSHHSVQREVIKENPTSRNLPPLRQNRGRLNPPSSNTTTPAIDGYKTQLGNQSLIWIKVSSRLYSIAILYLWCNLIRRE